MKKVNIVCRQSWYGLCDTTNRLLDECGQVWTGTRKEAIDLINQLYSDKYELAHNEYKRERYTITYNPQTN